MTVCIFTAMALGIGFGSLFDDVPIFLDNLSFGTANVPIAIGLILIGLARCIAW